MIATIQATPAADLDRCVTIHPVGWGSDHTIADALPEGADVRVIHPGGRLTIATKSRGHDWNAERFGRLVEPVAEGLGIRWEDSGTATYRDEGADAGAGGDDVFYLGANVAAMRGPVGIDLEIRPRPDLAIEVEISHPADAALRARGRLVVPKVRRSDPERRTFGSRPRRDDGTYPPADRGPTFPTLDAGDVLCQMRVAEEIGSSR